MQAQEPVTRVELPQGTILVRMSFGSEWDDDAYFDFCRRNPDLHIERTAQGEIVIGPPTGGESSFRNAEVISQLALWARRDGRGRAFDSSTQFLLPDGSGLSPVSNQSFAPVDGPRAQEVSQALPRIRH